jgi:hypothetical protein
VNATGGKTTPQGSLDEAIAALKKDVLSGTISTIQNYNFAILPYRTVDEFELRKKIRALTGELMAEGWSVLEISLRAILVNRIKAMGDKTLGDVIAREKSLYDRDPERALAYTSEKLLRKIEGPDGLAADVARLIKQFADEHPNNRERTLVLIGRAGALYPHFRSSALLKHIAGKTENLPVVLLYPGERRDTTSLSFMGELPADRDYRPRIYP